jgi:hypothetical protein
MYLLLLVITVWVEKARSKHCVIYCAGCNSAKHVRFYGQ